MSKSQDLITGALVADAASLGLHWIYDQDRVAEFGGDRPEFHDPDPKAYDGVPAFFAHGGKRAGDLSHYGEQMMVMVHALDASGGTFSRDAYEAAFQAHFGYGGTFTGYIDHATRDTLNAMARAGEDDTGFHGADDNQMPALSKLPPLIAAEQEGDFAAAVRVTNNNAISEEYGRVASAMLVAARDGADAKAIAEAGIGAATPEIAEKLKGAVQAADDVSVQDFTTQVGLACYLESAVPSVVHTLLSTQNYEAAIRANILAAGDSCGRSILLGALAGALYGVPKEWQARLSA